ncbi:hypothetical protein [Micromonospora sp. NPDC005324]|uniref:hypothetical protein n=1 Tax=Micromonospora sp. NPDC005324 TaxID=3157033 RepID=UPI0033B00107
MLEPFVPEVTESIADLIVDMVSMEKRPSDRAECGATHLGIYHREERAEKRVVRGRSTGLPASSTGGDG